MFLVSSSGNFLSAIVSLHWIDRVTNQVYAENLAIFLTQPRSMLTTECLDSLCHATRYVLPWWSRIFLRIAGCNILIFSGNYMHSSVWNCVVRQHIERHSVATVISFSMLTFCNCEIAQYWDAKNIKTVFGWPVFLRASADLDCQIRATKLLTRALQDWNWRESKWRFSQIGVTLNLCYRITSVLSN